MRKADHGGLTRSANSGETDVAQRLAAHLTSRICTNGKPFRAQTADDCSYFTAQSSPISRTSSSRFCSEILSACISSASRNWALSAGSLPYFSQDASPDCPLIAINASFSDGRLSKESVPSLRSAQSLHAERAS